VIDTNTEFESAPPEPAAPEVFPWPPREGASAFDAFTTTWRESCFHPTSFFRRMPRSGSYGAVLTYYLVLGVVVAGIELFWRSVLGFSLSDRLMNDDGSRLNDIVRFLLSPLILILALYLVTGACHLMLLVLRGATHGFETSSRVFAFSYGPAIANVIPMLGGLIGFVWMTVLAIIGLREAHQTDGSKAAAAVLVPLFLLFGLLFIAVLAAIVMGVLGTRL
jgi:hypothetical protein